jgi:hypothetical protein
VLWQGTGLARDPAAAVTRLERSCALNLSQGCRNLGVLHATGQHVKKDEARAAELFGKACVAGLAEACQNRDQICRSPALAASPGCRR